MGTYEAVVIGVSAGGLRALGTLLGALPAAYPLPVAVVQHMHAGSDGFLAEYLNERCALTVKEAVDKEALLPGRAYLAPAGYHLLIEEDRSFGLSVDARVNYSRPSIDVLFESAARVYEQRCIGVVLTGANRDGSAGLQAIKRCGGLGIVQEPASAEFDTMPRAAIAAGPVDHILPLAEIGALLRALVEGTGRTGD
ncbi:chemotaxis protein CheB [Paenibacillus athensensis]|uniref:protein-glutamate methylesterase n=1 Tax=Paenibacillus athensensis TaxID=1967502 RepID=A0A4Y8Q614_9BACL|nr:chemotaxis protein CheB [Paenibacillus athensensis]MCD1258421.1 chemotaxis protein CheB [Paenibacillus athensensis]